MLVATIMLVAASIGGFTINYYLLRSHVDPDVLWCTRPMMTGDRRS